MLEVAPYKYPQAEQKIEAYVADKVFIPLSQHIGAPAKAVVKKGDALKLGQLIGQVSAKVSAAVHSSREGKVEDIKIFNHPTLAKAPAVVIRGIELKEEKAWEVRDLKENLERDSLVNIVKESGIVGMGGAGFPTHIKLLPPKNIDVLIINGAECEPYLSCDYRLMLEYTEELLRGVGVLVKILSCRKVFIAIEDNKKEAIRKINNKINTKDFGFRAKVKILKSSYPQGAEKQLIYNITKRIVPAGGLPFSVGVLVQNVATTFAIYEATYLGKPLFERIVTFAGSCLKEPKNLRLRVGTLISELFEKGILQFRKQPRKVIMGGPMMGVSLDCLDYPILKTTSGVLFMDEVDIDQRPEDVCIRCGRCVDNCPMNLMPLEFVRLVKKERWKDLDRFYVSDCIECGNCAYVCPAKIPLVNYIKIAKAKLKSLA
ncbi:MAG: electron transport complex subunit RsxC [Candidatus Omnitrophica bacterium]|nr:electron transport complex subunit RsxC [Candidatus Omnitrophota bacterium]